MSETFTFNAQQREKTGKGASRAARREGFIPASLYGDSAEPISLLLDPKELQSQIIRKSLYNNIYKIKVGKKNIEALVRSVQLHPVTDNPLHVDLLRVGEKTLTNIHVPLVFINQAKSPGLRFGGNLNIVTHSVEISCNPKIAPKNFQIDLDGARVGTVVKIEDINLPEGAKTYYPKGFALASITSSGGSSDGEAKEG